MKLGRFIEEKLRVSFQRAIGSRKSFGTVYLTHNLRMYDEIYFFPPTLNIKFTEFILFYFVFVFFSGAIFEQGTDEVQTAFKLAVFKHNQNNTERRFELQAYVDVIKTADAFKLSKLSEFYFPFNRFISGSNF